ncbi:Vps51/Vps67 protein [Trypanosoma conorhini]|uniref:Vacuolar protein sorting-associated protein 51 homolog n=1 Tax=Trypanosoma conorhini TaxID=83891 RepID=A0A422PEF7_9TRYP|nr:Vps51/Vps67 protein [Trypanosoma conorhini]RNF16091.1 Vps51/Vps67 protein [Trypanosoma conorhini]
MSAGSTERRRRIREQLREFYGDPTASRERHPVEGGKAGTSPEMDVDSEFFNVGRYVTDLLRRESLKELVEADTQLLRSVRHLDGELQELVYQNYAKFISATDTIREMRDNITEMDAKLQALSSNVENIDEVSKSITDKLQSHRSRIEEMILTNRMLRKVQFLVELADTMRRLIERQEYTACVKYWVVGDSFFAKHTNLSSITKIHDECRALAGQLYAKLQETVVTTSLEDPEAMDVIRCVVEDMRLLRATSLFAAAAAATAEETATATTPAADAPASFETEILETLMKNVSGGFAAGVQGVNSAIRAALAVPNFAAMDRARWADVLEHVQLQEALAQLKSLCALFHSNSERVYSLFNREGDPTVALRIVEEVQPVLIDIMAPITAYIGELFIAMVEAFCSDAAGALAAPATVGSGLSAIFTTLATRLKYYSGTLKTLGVNYLDNAHSQQSRQYAALVDQSVLDIFQRLLAALQAKLTEGASVPDSIASSATAKDPAYQQLLQFCVSRFLLARVASAADVVGLASLVGTDTLQQGDVAGVQRRCTYVARAFTHRGIVLLGQLHLSWVAAASCPVDAVDPTSTVALNFGIAHCLCEFVRQLGTIYALLRDGVLACEAVRERGSVGSAMGAGSSRLYTSAGSGRSSGKAASRRLVVAFARETDNALQSTVDRIFSKQSQSNAELRTLPREIRPASVVAAVTIYVLKGLIEHVRTQSFTRNGFQCVQLSCTFLLHALTPPAPLASSVASAAGSDTPLLSPLGEWLGNCRDDEMLKLVPQLLNECCTSAYERCREKAPLTSVVVEKLASSALESMQGASPLS